jgi:DNA repair exonuclease SbcCD ATPase subunit
MSLLGIEVIKPTSDTQRSSITKLPASKASNFGTDDMAKLLQEVQQLAKTEEQEHHKEEERSNDKSKLLSKIYEQSTEILRLERENKESMTTVHEQSQEIKKLTSELNSKYKAMQKREERVLTVKKELYAEKAKVQSLRHETAVQKAQLHTEKDKVQSLQNKIQILKQTQEDYDKVEQEKYGECFGLEHLFSWFNEYFAKTERFTDEDILAMLGVKDLDRQQLKKEYDEQVKRKYLDAMADNRIWGTAHQSDKTLAKIWWIDNCYKFIQDIDRRNSIANRLKASDNKKPKSNIASKKKKKSTNSVRWEDMQARLLAL